ncbi:MAG: arginine--tRNA ligase [Candidatus Omnitrophota bacterium]
MSQDLKNTIIKIVEKIVRRKIPPGDKLPIELTIPKEKQFGDWSLNIAMRLVKILKKSPQEIAQMIIELIKKELAKLNLTDRFERIEFKNPGFINISLSASALFDILNEVQAQKQDFGKSAYGQNKKVLIEFVSANPTGPLSIAHARQAAVGDALANILNFCGFRVSREYYINDEGNQIKNLGLSLRARYLELLKVECVNFPEDGYKGQYLYELAKKIITVFKDKYKQQSIEESLPFFSEYAANEILTQIKNELLKFGVKFDNWYSQKDHITKENIDQVLAQLTDKGFIYIQDGATWFKSTEFGDDKDRVLIKSDGQMTYLMPDIAYHNLKFERGFNRLIDILGPDHHGYINRLKAAVCALGYTKDDLSILVIQLATLFREGKPVMMSTRAGEYITLTELIEEVGADAARFFFLMRRCDSHLEFDLELAKKQTLENPVYYVQYAHARICGIRETFAANAESQEMVNIENILKTADLSLLKEAECFDLMRKLNCFTEILINAASECEVQGLTTYLRQLAGEFHAFYNKYRIYTEDKTQKEFSKARFLLVDCVRQVLFNGLSLLGVSAPEEM